MKHLFLLITGSCFLAGKNAEKFPLPPEVEVHKLRLEKRALKQALIVQSQDACPCLNLSGKKLVSCMDYACEEDVRATFAHMTLHARVHYLMSMDILAYKRFLDAFENEQQWQEALVTLTSDEQKLLPPTLLQQKHMIRDTWISCSDVEVGYYSKGSKDPQARDIAAWRNKTLADYEKMKQHAPVLWQWINERFNEQKIKMLHKTG